MTKEHKNKGEIICPYCDYEYSDSSENIDLHGFSRAEFQCDSCDELFWLTIDMSVDYSTEPM